MQNIFIPTRKQSEYLLNANARWNFKIGAVRSGKSYVDVMQVIPERIITLAGETGLNVILGVTRETIERNVLQPMRERYTGAVVGMINSRNVAKICGQDVYCLGAEKVTQVSKIQGSSIKYCYGDEIAKWHPDVFAMLQSRLDKPYSRFDGSCNPEHPSHWLKQFIDREDINSYIQKYTIVDNPFLPESFVEAIQNEYRGTVYEKRYIYGEWALAEGLIFPMYEDAIVDAIPEWQEDEPRRYALSIDYGTMNAFAALLWEYHAGVWYASRGFYYSGRETGVQKTDEEYSQALDLMLADILEYYDGLAIREKLETIIDPSAASFIALLNRRGKYKVRKADNAVLDGIRETATAMSTGKIKISGKIKEWRDEAGGYVWDDSEGEERPVKVNDHYMDATRYFVKTKRVTMPRATIRPMFY
ncbi:MAG: PBSX family phage terminase large subunit [Methanomicrobium sp.]|nr:PBSX family phage terminase large subunit [Methanomicrobium sp.]